MKVSVLVNKKRENIICDVLEVVSELLKMNVEIMMNEDYHEKLMNYNITWNNDEEDIIKNCDVVLALGGDGTIIRNLKKAAEFNKPVVGINTGRLGFVSSLEKSELKKLSFMVDENYFTDERIMFDAQLCGKEYSCLALNDIVISRSQDSQIVDYDIFIGNNQVCNFRADGVIISTPTGSTAYSLSAGGPIIVPDVNCAVVTPICAHSLNSRAIVLNSDEEICVKYRVREGSEIYVMCDGNTVLRSSESGELKIRKSALKAKIIQFDKDRFYQNMRLKIMN